VFPESEDLFMLDIPPAASRFREAAERLGLSPDIRITAESARTAAEAAAACGSSIGQIVKSLVFAGRDSDRPYLLLVSGPNRVDEAGVRRQLGEELVRMEPRRVRALTGYAIGGIPPLGHVTTLATYMDEELLNFKEVFAAAGAPNALFAVDPRRLLEATAARVIAVATDKPA
jgi:prolyl-tRNA editing enzyme YbaK/EbsC (Cys-tRNA(Pro) deacylase)